MVHNMAKYFSTIFFYLFLSNNLVILYSSSSVYGEKLVPCYFIFGDSLADSGNNNGRSTLAKANYLPYGIDYPGGPAPTGRFTNGRNVADIMAELMGFDNHIPPFSTANGDVVLNGVNYASAGAGILDPTGKQLGNLISLDEQLANHRTTINRITAILGNVDSAQKHLSQCIYHVGMGSNDYAGFSLIPNPFSPEQFASILINKYSTQMRNLYSSGARKVAIFGLGPIGCVPIALRGITNGTSCVSTTNYAVRSFNDKVKSMIDVLNRDLIGAKFTYVDTYGITVSDPAFNGMNANIPCCTISGSGTCILGGVTCSSRSDFVYFDGFHPTEAAVRIVGRRAFRAQSPSDAYPSDIQNLAQAQL